jgi:hypothetical protein
MGKLRLLAVLLLVGCVWATSGCRNPGVRDADTSAWVTFEGDGISLRLPATFVGGDPRDPLVLAALEKRAAGNPIPALREELLSIVDYYREEAEAADPFLDLKLVAWGEPNSEGRMPSVNVDTDVRRTDQSMQAHVDEYCRLPGAEVTVESVAEDRAYCVRRRQVKDSETNKRVWALEHIVFRFADPSFGRVVLYGFDSESDTALDQIFRASAETIVLGDYGHEKSTSGAEI